MKLTTKKFSKETIKKYTVQSKLPLSSLQTLDWNPNLNKTQRKAIVKEVKRLLAGSVIYFRQATTSNGNAGVAYLTPVEIFWQGKSLYILGDVVYVCKQDRNLSVFKTCETNYILPEYKVHVVKHKDFTDMLYKQLTPRAKF